VDCLDFLRQPGTRLVTWPGSSRITTTPEHSTVPPVPRNTGRNAEQIPRPPRHPSGPNSQLHRGSAADTGQPEDRGRSRSGRSTDPPRPASVGARRRWSGPPVASDNDPHPSATHRLPVFMPASPHRRQHLPGREAGAAGVPGALEQSECGPPGPQPAVLLGTPLDSCRSWSEVPGPPV